ncbi:MAG: glycosyltransferase [Thermomicrobiales bacterium]
MTSAEPRQPADLPLHGHPSASVVIPVHNKATITRQCLDALLAEADDGVRREIVVVNDGSSDLTAQFLAGYGDRIRVVHHEAAQGFAGACNAGYAAASGEFVVLLNNDTIPTKGWLRALVAYAQQHPRAAVVGSKLLFPNNTIQHAGVVFGLDSLPHHIYSGFPADHPCTAMSRRYQVVTGACALFRREPWDRLGGLDTSYRNGWEDVDFCLRAGEAGYEVHFCAESVLYHFESATRDVMTATERANRALFSERWQEKVIPDDFGYYWLDGLLSAHYGARYPIKLTVSPLLAGFEAGEQDRLADRMLFDRSRQVMILVRNNIVLNVRVQEAEARAAEAERQLAILRAQVETVNLPAHQSEPAAAPETTSSETRNEVVEATDEPPAANTLPHRIVGMVESLSRIPEVFTDGILPISGWTLTDTGEVRVEALVDGELRGEIPHGEPRPDAAALFPGYPAGENAGFSGEISVGDLPDGMHELTIRITGAEDSRAELKTMFEVDSRAFETGRVIGRLDSTVRGANYASGELAPVSGWALASSGIRSLTVLVNGEPRGSLHYGALRPDAAKRRRQYPNADHCGFAGSIPLAGLSSGTHELVVVITANDGQSLELPTQIAVDDGDYIDAGMPAINRQYPAWLAQRQAAPAETPASDRGPTFDLLIPVTGACENELDALATSISAQTYPAWRARVLIGNDSGDVARSGASQLAGNDPRFGVTTGSGDSMAEQVNAAMRDSNADLVAVLSPGVILSPDALARIAGVASDRPDTALVYVDDDRVDPVRAVRWNPFFKPDWSPDLLLAMNYLGPLVVFSRERALQVGGVREGVGDAAIFDLALRVSEQPGPIIHVPEVLATTIAVAPQRGEPWHLRDWSDSERAVILDAVSRRKTPAQVELGLHPGLWRVRYSLDELPAVTAVIPTGGKLDLLRPCLEDLLERTDYPPLDILLVDNSRGENVANLVGELAPNYPNVRRIVDDRKPFNFPALNNDAVRQVTTPYVLMLNDDVSVIDPGWLRAMVEQAQRPGVAIVGPKLLYPDDTIQHAGVILGPFGGSVHVFKRLPGHNPGFLDLPDAVRNFSAVTFACALIDRKVYEEIGGMDATLFPVAFNDTDFCLRVREAGYDVVYTPHACLYHHESVTKTVIAHPDEIMHLRERWGHVIDHDPFYNPNLTRTGEDARLNMDVPRVS